MESLVHLSVLGRFEVSRADQPVMLQAKKAQALLAFLAVEYPAVVNRENIATLLWSHTGDDRARHNVRQALSHIRQHVGPVVLSEGEGLRLDPARCNSDVLRFKAGTDAGDAATLADCLKLYRGELLEGFHLRAPEFDDWLRDAREHLRKSACHVIERLAEILISEGRDSEAERVLYRRLAIDPACEKAHRALMELFARTNRRSDALRQFQVCADALLRELGATPCDETIAVHDRIRHGRNTTPEPPASASAPLPPLAQGTEGPVVAVLPFDNLSGEEDLYLADGIAEDLTTALSCFHDLEVIARGSSFMYRGQEVPENEIATALGADFLVRGSVRRAGGKVRIGVQLLDGARSRLVWGHQYEREIVDVFEIQNEIVSTLVSTLVGRVEKVLLNRVRSVPMERLASYDLLLKGKFHHHLFTPEDCRLCIDLFDQAIDRDPQYALAHAWLACGLGQAMVHHLGDQSELVDRSQAAAERGLELDENESECHRVLAQNHLIRGNLPRALWHQERALFLNPNDDRSICAMGEILTFAGRAAEGEEWVRKSLRLNPYHPQRYWTHLARALLHRGCHEEALTVLDRIGRPRTDDLVYAVAASAGWGSPAAIERSLSALRIALPDFDAEAFVSTLPYERAEDRQMILGALASVL